MSAPVQAGPAVRPEIVTLCGSMRFMDRMLAVAAAETAAGAVVLAPFVVVSADDQAGQMKVQLDELHRFKIRMSDRVVVVSDETAYVGESPRAEMAFARDLGVPVEVIALTRPTSSTARDDR